jgi:hypothetical protein
MWFRQDGRKLDSGFRNVQGRLFSLLGLKDEVVIEASLRVRLCGKMGVGSRVRRGAIR